MKPLSYFWKPAGSHAEIRAADIIERIDGRSWVAFDVSALATLAHNLATAGGMSAMFRAGDNHGFHMGEDSSQCTCQWAPNLHGEAYRGFTRCEQDEADDDYYARRAELDIDDYDGHDDGMGPLLCCPRYTWGDGTHDLNCGVGQIEPVDLDPEAS